MKRPLLACLAAVVLAAAPAGGAAAVSPTFRITIVHYVRRCHVWSTTGVLGPAAKVTLRQGTRLEIRVSCPMDFDFRQVGGPRLVLGTSRTPAGTTRMILFRTRGVYRLTAKNVQSSEEAGLQTLGPDNALALTVVVR